MSQINTENFYNTETAPILDRVKGPVDSFTTLGDEKLLANAIETGEIPPGSFAECAVFGEGEGALEDKKLRYEAKRALEIQLMMGGVSSTEDEAALLYARQTVSQAVLVEAARKMKTESVAGHMPERHRRLYSDAIDDTQKELYPQPDVRVAQYAARLALQAIQETNPAHAAVILKKYPFMGVGGETPAVLLSPEKRQQWRDHLHETFEPAFDSLRDQMLDEGVELMNATLAKATSIFIDKVGISLAENGEGWCVVERPDIVGFRIEPKTREVLCGRRTREITWSAFEKLMCHEVLVHVARAENGYKKGSRALQSGLPGNQETEEGLGIAIEKLWSGDDMDRLGRDHFRYLAVTYADGTLDGMGRHTETETFTFISDLIAAEKPESPENGLFAARKAGYDHVKRAFRGMPEGKIMYSNLAYLSGKLKMMAYLEQSGLAPNQLLPYLQQGKFNPMDNEHLRFIDKTAIAL